MRYPKTTDSTHFAANRVADLERAERRAADPRYSSVLRAAAFRRAERIRREICERPSPYELAMQAEHAR